MSPHHHTWHSHPWKTNSLPRASPFRKHGPPILKSGLAWYHRLNIKHFWFQIESPDDPSLRTVPADDAQLTRDHHCRINMRTGKVLRAHHGYVQNATDAGAGAPGGQCATDSAWPHHGSRCKSRCGPNATIRCARFER